MRVTYKYDLVDDVDLRDDHVEACQNFQLEGRVTERTVSASDASE